LVGGAERGIDASQHLAASMDSRVIGMPSQPAPAGRALAQAGIERLAVDSPEARGRAERAFRMPQDRLPEEVALAGIAAAPPAISRYGRRPGRWQLTRRAIPCKTLQIPCSA
jgi:hypothetical protein